MRCNRGQCARKWWTSNSAGLAGTPSTGWTSSRDASALPSLAGTAGVSPALFEQRTGPAFLSHRAGGTPALPGAMYRFALTRLSMVIPTFIGLTLLAFFLIRIIPGDPIETMAGERGIDPGRPEPLRAEYRFDHPALVHYGLYIPRL